MRSQTIYLAVIAVLVVALVYAGSKAVRAHRVMAEVEARFGLHDGRASAPRASPLRAMRAADLLRPRTYDEYRREVDALLARAQALGDFGPSATRLAEACGKALAGGKRLRAVVLLEVARAASARRLRDHAAGAAEAGEEPTPADAGEVALFVEYLHAASLVVDDLPEFDNDATRRGRPALHAEMGPAVAQLAALSLVAAAFQNMCRQVDWVRDNCPEVKNADRIGTRVCAEVSRALGALGAAGGQYMDVSGPEDLFREHGEGAVADLVYRKTATFFEVAVVAGWLVAGGEPAQTDAMRDIGRLLGTAFQIADDIGDAAGDAARREQGKPGWNFANEYGRGVAAREMERNLNGARLLLAQAGLWTPLWERELYPLVRAMAGPAGPEPAPAPECVPRAAASGEFPAGAPAGEEPPAGEGEFPAGAPAGEEPPAGEGFPASPEASGAAAGA